MDESKSLNHTKWECKYQDERLDQMGLWKCAPP
jgi:hypothetical protein